MSAMFRATAVAVLLVLFCGCSSNNWYPIARICVINAVTQQREPDVLIAFTDNRSGKVTYAKTGQNGLAWLDIPQSGWGSMNTNKFKVELGKPGFDPPMFCDYRYPAGVLPKDCPYSIYCIVPVGTDRSKLKGHNHEDPQNRFTKPEESQQELKREWEAFRRGCAPADQKPSSRKVSTSRLIE